MRNTCFFSAPIIVLFLLPAILFLKSGEFVSVEQVIARQRSGPIVFGRAYANDTFEYKRKAIVENRPTVLALGTSRVMQFRKEFFTTTTSFYNGGGSISSIEDLNTFYASLPIDYNPKIIILGVDQNFFNPTFYEENKAPYPATNGGLLKQFFTYGWRQVYFDYPQGKISLQEVTQPKSKATIGLFARIKGSGFRSDGSYYYREQVFDPSHTQKINEAIDKVVKKVATEGNYYFYGEKIEPRALATLNKFLAESKKRNIQVIGFIPPFAPRLLQTLEDQSKNRFYTTMQKLPDEVQKIFHQYDYTLYNYTDSRLYQSPDNEYVDTIHGSEKTYLRFFITMASKDTALRGLVDTESLKRSLGSSNNALEVFQE